LTFKREGGTWVFSYQAIEFAKGARSGYLLGKRLRSRESYQAKGGRGTSHIAATEHKKFSGAVRKLDKPFGNSRKEEKGK